MEDRAAAERALVQSDVKDIAAFANSGGGLLVFGVTEEQAKATARVDVGRVTESHERTCATPDVTYMRFSAFCAAPA